ncbi:MAG: histidine--tRNA ligase [Candidatus Kapabacteria bacterium]|nr:histidine--tRNA ligase [Candidatus Kapabacteria bacterium]
MLQAVRGTKDLLPDVINDWHYIEEIFRKVTKKFNYKELRTPIFEYTEVFSRGVGEGTDIVNKEMYTFQDKGENSLTLRPEMTASLVRAVIQNNLTAQETVARLWYFGPFFRYERPQKGRQRQFHQFGAECLSSANPESDVEILLLADNLIKELGIKDYKLLLNSLGNKSSILSYKKELTSFLKSEFENLSEDSKRRLDQNPLRVLDSKDEKDLKVTQNAPKLIDFLDEESKEHFKFVTNSLDHLNINYEINHKLVRGLDYYSHTVFEFQSNYLGSQDSFGGGGRYNELFEELGGKHTPAVGFAFGVERLLMILESQKLINKNNNNLDFYIVCFGKEYFSYVIEISTLLQKNGYSVNYDISRKSFKSQLKDSDKLKANFSVIIGENEVISNQFVVKNMISGEQMKIKLENFSKFVKF